MLVEPWPTFKHIWYCGIYLVILRYHLEVSVMDSGTFVPGLVQQHTTSKSSLPQTAYRVQTRQDMRSGYNRQTGRAHRSSEGVLDSTLGQSLGVRMIYIYFCLVGSTAKSFWEGVRRGKWGMDLCVFIKSREKAVTLNRIKLQGYFSCPNDLWYKWSPT